MKYVKTCPVRERIGIVDNYAKTCEWLENARVVVERLEFCIDQLKETTVTVW